MKFNLLKQFGFMALSLTGLLAVNAQAALVTSCEPVTAAKVTNTSACEYSSGVSQDDETGAVVNGQGFFGFSDWSYLDKDDGLETEDGSWSLEASWWSQFDDIMLIFKSGHHPLVGYLANDGATSGTWSSPITSPEFSLDGKSQVKDVSHITYYGRGKPAEVPEPSLLVLLMLGLGSVALGRLRTR